MKKIVALLFAALLLATPRAFAQQNNDSMMFNHMAIGIDWGVLGRAGIDVTAPISPMFDVRAGVNTAFVTTALATAAVGSYLQESGLSLKDGEFTFTLKEPYKGNGLDISKISTAPKFHTTNLELLFDFFPGKTSNFHITAGAFFSLGGSLLSAELSALNASGQPGIPQSDWANTTIFGISTNDKGKLLITVKPYIGVGWGRPVALDRRVSFNFDLGLYYIGGVHAYSYDFSAGKNPKTVELNSAWINSDESLKKNIGKFAELIDMGNGLPVLPMIRFSLFFRLF